VVRDLTNADYERFEGTPGPCAGRAASHRGAVWDAGYLNDGT